MKAVARFLLLVGAIAWLSSCVANNSPILSQDSLALKGTIDLQELWENREALDGQVVSVRGYYYDNPPTSSLFQDKATSEKSGKKWELWIGARAKGSKSPKWRGRSHSFVIIEGRFVNEPLGIFGRFFASLEDITRFEVIAK